MDHSLHSYLKRRSTEELDAMLKYYLEEERWKQYGKAIMEILQILEDREKDVPIEITSQRKLAIERYRERMQ